MWLRVVLSFFVAVPAFAGDPVACTLELLPQRLQVSDAGQLLKNAKSAALVEIQLPYVMTSQYSARLAKIEEAVAGMPPEVSVYLSYADRKTQIVPMHKNVNNLYPESVHAMAQNIEGFYFTLGFETKEAREGFVRKVGSRSVLVSEGQMVFEGKAQHTIALTPEQFSALAQYLTDSGPKDRFAASSRRELEDLSDYNSLVQTNTIRYYFKGQSLVGYGQHGKFYRYVEASASTAELANFASHFNILKRQRGADPISFSATDQIKQGRESIEEDLAAIRRKSALSTADREMFDQRIESMTVPNLVAMNAPASADQHDLFSNLMWLATTRLELLHKQIASTTEPFELKIPDLVKVSNDVSSLAKGEASSQLFLRFIWMKDLAVHASNYLRTSEFIFVEGSVLHDQLAIAAFGHKIVTRTDFTPRFLRGGLLSVTYGADGKAAQVEFADDKIILSDGSVVRMSAEEKVRLESQLQKALNFHAPIMSQ